jgi:hypothetical protein
MTGEIYSSENCSDKIKKLQEIARQNNAYMVRFIPYPTDNKILEITPNLITVPGSKKSFSTIIVSGFAKVVKKNRINISAITNTETQRQVTKYLKNYFSSQGLRLQKRSIQFQEDSHTWGK